MVGWVRSLLVSFKMVHFVKSEQPILKTDFFESQAKVRSQFCQVAHMPSIGKSETINEPVNLRHDKTAVPSLLQVALLPLQCTNIFHLFYIINVHFSLFNYG